MDWHVATFLRDGPNKPRLARFPAVRRASSVITRELPAVFILAGLLQVGAVGNRPAKAGDNQPPPAAVSALLERACASCHEGPDAEAGLDLTSVPNPLASPADLSSWLRILDRVEAGEMPPPDAETLSQQQREAFGREAGDWLRDLQEQRWQQTGRVVGRRLTNLQLERTLHDLLGIDIPLANQLPEDPRTNGFTTVAAGQSMSHFQIQAHLDIVDIALDEAFRRVTTPADEWTRVLSAPELCRQDPSRRCREPELIDGQAVTWNGNVIYYGRLPATQASDAGWYRFTIRASALNVPDDHGVWCSVRTGLCVSSAPLLEWATAFEATAEPAEWTFETWLPQGHMLEVRPADVTLKQARFAGGQIGTGEGAPQNVPGVAIHSVVMERIHRQGPDAIVHERLFDQQTPASELPAEPADEDVRRHELARLIRRFATRAFRRPVADAEIAPYVAIGELQLTEGVSFVDALRSGYRGILCSPRFLYFQESPGLLDDFAIASRLSYFLWNSMPDSTLTDLAEEGQLRDPDVVRNQVARMLADGRSRQFVEDFAREWLDLSLIDFTEPDRRLFRDFDQVVQHSMLEETHRYLDMLLREDRSVSELVHSETTFLNSRLARYYKVEGVRGDSMRPVSLTLSDHRSGGVLTQGAILKVTANGTNTSPVLRGLWVSERLLGLDVPPPPSNVPAIEPDIRGATTIREMLEKHRADPSCAACHAKFDPPGYALENYDPTGRWRDDYPIVNDGKVTAGARIDASSVLPDGRAFRDIAELEQLLATTPHAVALGVATRLMTYGTGAPITFADRSDIEHLVDSAEMRGFGLRTLVAEVAASRLFTIK